MLTTRLFVCVSRQCVPCTLDDVLGPSNIPEARNDEKALIEQLVNFLSGTDENELAELDKALGIDKLVQVSQENRVENVNLSLLLCTVTQRMIIQCLKEKQTFFFSLTRVAVLTLWVRASQPSSPLSAQFPWTLNSPPTLPSLPQLHKLSSPQSWPQWVHKVRGSQPLKQHSPSE